MPKMWDKGILKLVDLVTVGEALAIPLVSIFSILYAKSAITKAFKTEQKTVAVERIFETMGFRNFKIQDLQANKLDDKGFERFLILMANVAKWYGPTVGTTGKGPLAGLQELTAFLGQLPQNQKQQEAPNQNAGVPA